MSAKGRLERELASHRDSAEGKPISVAWRREERDTLVLALHVQPGASRTEIAGMHGDALKVRLAAPPVDGKANAALLRFLADAFGVPLRQVTLVRGESSRQKTVRVEAPAARPDRAWASESGAG